MPLFPDNDIISLIGSQHQYELAESVGPDLRLGDLFDGSAGDGLADLRLGYGTAAGEPLLRDAIADRHGVNVPDVVTTVGGVHALFLLAFTLCGPGDEAVIATPVFPLARNALLAAGATVRDLPLSFDDGYQLSPRQLESLLSERTRLVCLASPQNPAGVALPKDTLRLVLAAMQHRCPQARLIVDETYREAVYGHTAPADSAIGLGERVVVLASLSKCHGAPGLRLGWLITREAALRRQLTTAKFNTVIACSSVDEALALRVLNRPQRIMAARSQRLQQGRDATARWVADNAALVEWVPPDAGALCCVRLRREAFDDAAVARFYDAMQGEGARVGPGTWFGDEPRVFRLGFGFLSLPQLLQALDATARALHRAAG